MTAAAKIQSIYRRNKVMSTLEAQGLSTSAIRNRKRRRKASKGPWGSRVAQSEDAPSFLHCCGAGLVFGDATEDDDAGYRQYQKKMYEERQKQQAAHETMLRKRFLRDKRINATVVEAVEVVD